MIAQNIRFIRQKKGYSQEYMSIKLDISQNAYSKMELGRTGLSVTRVYDIARVLEVSVYEILPESMKGMPFFSGLHFRIRKRYDYLKDLGKTLARRARL